MIVVCAAVVCDGVACAVVEVVVGVVDVVVDVLVAVVDVVVDLIASDDVAVGASVGIGTVGWLVVGGGGAGAIAGI